MTTRKSTCLSFNVTIILQKLRRVVVKLLLLTWKLESWKSKINIKLTLPITELYKKSFADSRKLPPFNSKKAGIKHEPAPFSTTNKKHKGFGEV